MNKSCKSLINQTGVCVRFSLLKLCIKVTIQLNLTLLLSFWFYFLRNSSLTEKKFFHFHFFWNLFSEIVLCFYKIWISVIRQWFLYSFLRTLPILFVQRKKYLVKNKTFYYKNITLFVIHADVFYQIYRKDCFFNLDLEYRNIEYQLLDQVSNLKPNYLLCDLV